MSQGSNQGSGRGKDEPHLPNEPEGLARASAVPGRTATVPTTAMRAFIVSQRRFDTFVACSLATLQWCWAAYLIFMPAARLTRSPVWTGALAVVPGHDLRWLGSILAMSGGLLLVSRIDRKLYLLGLPGHGIGCASWAMLSGSFAYAAYIEQGLGAANAVVSLFISALHAAFIWQRRL